VVPLICFDSIGGGGDGRLNCAIEQLIVNTFDCYCCICANNESNASKTCHGTFFNNFDIFSKIVDD
jgi:hypothetical protein